LSRILTIVPSLHPMDVEGLVERHEAFGGFAGPLEPREFRYHDLFVFRLVPTPRHLVARLPPALHDGPGALVLDDQSTLDWSYGRLGEPRPRLLERLLLQLQCPYAVIIETNEGTGEELVVLPASRAFRVVDDAVRLPAERDLTICLATAT